MNCTCYECTLWDPYSGDKNTIEYIYWINNIVPYFSSKSICSYHTNHDMILCNIELCYLENRKMVAYMYKHSECLTEYTLYVDPEDINLNRIPTEFERRRISPFCRLGSSPQSFQGKKLKI